MTFYVHDTLFKTLNLVPDYDKIVTMYVRDVKADFFDVISTERILVLVNTDVDAVCATKIIHYLFKCDHVLYTLVPVTGKRDFYSAHKNNIEGIKYCLLVNCGGTMDLCDFLDPSDEVIFFINSGKDWL